MRFAGQAGLAGHTRFCLFKMAAQQSVRIENVFHFN